MKRVILIFILTSPPALLAQNLTRGDYARAVSFLWDNVNNKKAYNLSLSPNWLLDSTGLWYVHFAPAEKTYYLVSFNPLKKSPLFDHAALATQLGQQLQETIDPKSLPIENLLYKKGDITFGSKGKQFKWTASTSQLSVNERPETPNHSESRSPNGKWIAYSENYNLFVKSTATGEVKQLSTGGRKNYEYASYYGWSDIIEGENGDRPRRFSAEWTPDSRYIQTNICDLRNARKMYLLDWSIDTLYRAKLLGYYRGSPGDTTVVHLVPIVLDVQTGKEYRLPMPRIPHELGYSFDWLKEPGMAIVHHNTRGYHRANLFKVDVTTGKQQHLYTEESDTNIDGFSYFLNESKDRLVVTSEKSGWKHIYSIDLKTAGVKQLTSGSFFVNAVVEVNKDGVYFQGWGKEPNRNPYEQYIYRVGHDGKNVKLMTPEPGNHDTSGSPDRLYFTDVISTPQQATVSVLRETKTGKVLMELSKAEVTGLIAMKWSPPQAFTGVGKDGKSTIHGLLWKPTNFDASRKYPIIDNSYTGPHGQTVPRTFSRGISINNQALAELGFIVMMVDGLGTAGRSKEFHNYSYKKMGFNLEDHVRAIRQLSKQFSWIDTTRVGIFGHSAGGYDAGHAMVQYPNFYKVAVASSADHDFRMEKAWWPEMYMGWPVDSSYHEQSTITMAGNLKGKLLITHGGIDENVNPSATFKLAEMLIRADKQFDMVILPSQRHGYTGQHQLYFTRKRWNYFVEHLGGSEPIWDFPWK